MTRFELEPSETLLASWPVEPVGPAGSTGRRGWLVLTDRRCLFYRRAGALGPGRPIHPPLVSLGLEQLHSVSPRQFSMRVGYGDLIPIPGIEIDGHEFRLHREAPSGAVVAAVLGARNERLSGRNRDGSAPAPRPREGPGHPGGSPETSRR